MQYQHVHSSRLATCPAADFEQLKWVDSPANPAIPLGKAGVFDHGAHYYPRVLQVGEMLFVWYLGQERVDFSKPAPFRLGLATSHDGIHWVKSKANPVFGPGPADAWDKGIYGHDVMLIDGRFHLFYPGTRRREDGGEIIRIGLARSEQP